MNSLNGNSIFSEILMENMPYGVMVLDENGSILTVNGSLERSLGTTGLSITGQPLGDAIGCRKARNIVGGCGFERCSRDCETRRMITRALNQNRKQKRHTTLEIRSNGQVRNLQTLVQAVPFTVNEKRYVLILFRDLTEDNATTTKSASDAVYGIVGRDEKIISLIETIERVAEMDMPVLIQGESGTGKELVALAVHEASQRSHRRFVPINCGALPETLIETELFGHVKGAFTGAIRRKKGRFELAHQGSLFLDEVSELNPFIQIKLLRVLQDGGYWPVGSERRRHADARIIAASNRILTEEVAAGRFREDLYYRLSVVPLVIPPLRDRQGDIPLLLEHFVTQYGKAAGRPKVGIGTEAFSLLQNYHWPGNVRELQNTVQFALVRCRGRTIMPRHLPSTVQPQTPMEFHVKRRKPKLQAADVYNALKKTNGNRLRCAEILGVSRSTLYRFFEREGYDPQNLKLQSDAGV